MADLIIKPATGDGNKLILQDKDGDAVLTTADTGASLTNINALTATTATVSNLTVTTGITQPVIVSGGNATYTFGSYTVHAFTSDGVFSIQGGTKVCDILMVGGGGSGGSHHGAPGGAGGLLYGQLTLRGTFNCLIGAGGIQQGSWNIRGYEGGRTEIPEIGAVALGGGSGAGYDDDGADGGSGGGSMGNGSRTNRAGYGLQSDSASTQRQDWGERGDWVVVAGTGGLTGYGNDGGNGVHSGTYPSGGGGGAGAAGGAPTGSGGNTDAGVGGAGKDYSGVFGTTYGQSGWFAGGGGGATYSGGNAGAGGQGGGAAGTNNGQATPTPALANSGGGGGAHDRPNRGGQGGSGIILIRYAT